MKKLLFSALIIIIIIVLSMFFYERNYLNPVNEKYRVYSDLIESRFNDVKEKSIVIMDSEGWPLGSDKTSMEEILETYKKVIPELELSTVKDYELNIQKNVVLESNFHLTHKYYIYTNDKFKALFNNNQNGWGQFHELYPDSIGVISFSNIGFNEKKDQALLCYEFGSNYLATDKCIYFLVKIKNHWVIKKSLICEMS